MRLRLFVALDASEASARAVEHVSRLVRSGGYVAVTLFHACPRPPAQLETGGAEDLRRERAIEDEQRERRREWEEKSRETAERDVFAPARRLLAEAGLSDQAITIRSRLDVEPHPDLPQMIVDEASTTGTDAIVIGRRRRSRLKAMVLGSVASKVLERQAGGAVWIVE